MPAVTPREISPYNLFQERYRDEPWRLLCCTIMLNLTTGRALESVHGLFFRLFPGPSAGADGDEELMRLVLSPLGMQNVRTKRIKDMSRAYLTWDGTDPLDLPGIGEYGRDSYELFVRGVLLPNVQDKELRRYVEWAQGKIL